VRQRNARAGQAVTPETVAQYRAARAFLLSEWFGASLMVASVTLLYLFGRPDLGLRPALAIGSSLAVFAVGAYVFWTSHRTYLRIGFLWAKRWDTGAIVVAGSGAFFWGLFALLLGLSWAGVELLPE
jgi:hypothetical protein